MKKPVKTKPAVSQGGKPKKSIVAPNARPHHDESVATEIARNAFSRERFEFLLKSIFILCALLFASIVGNVVLGLRDIQTKYFALSTTGSIIEIAPLDRPIQSNQEVLVWATEAVTQAFTLSFANYQSQFDSYKMNFTTSGWKGFQDALTRNGTLDQIISNKLVTSAVPQSAPVITHSGLVDNNRYGWRLAMPILLTFESASTRTSQTLNIEVVVSRRPELENPKGLGIVQIYAR